MKYALKLAVDYARIEKMAIVDDSPVLDVLYKAIDCEMIEIVRAKGLPEGYVMIVDEEGLLRENATLNFLASYIYGTHDHGQPIVGNAVIMKEKWGPEGTELEWLAEEEVNEMESWAEKNWRPSVRAISNWYYSVKDAMKSEK